MNDQLLPSIKNHITPDFVAQASTVLGESTGQTKAGLFAAIPTLLSGIVSKASTPSGASDLIQTIKKEGLDMGTPSIPTSTSLEKGQTLIESIFGARANGVVDQFSTRTGLNSSFSKKILGIAAPLVMSVVASKVRTQGFSPSALSNYLSEQNVSIPDTNGTVWKTEMPITHAMTPPKKKRIGRYVAYAALLLAAVWFFFGRNVDQPSDEVTTTQSAPSDNQITLDSWRTGDADELVTSDPELLTDFRSAIHADSDINLPKRYTFKSVTFATGSSELSPEARETIRQIAEAIVTNPDAKIRIEGNADNTGDTDRNRELADARASVVRQELADAGVDMSQIEMVGVGESAPVDTNDTAYGRRMNRRIDFVILSR